MANQRENRKTPKQKYLDAMTELSSQEEEYTRLYTGREHLKMALKKSEKIAKMKIDLVELDLRQNDEVLSDGCKSYLATVYAYEKYKKWSTTKDKGNKFTNKGLMVEGDSIVMLSKLDGNIYEKNESVIENDYIKGTPDIIYGDDRYVIDVKSSWDIESFLSNLSSGLPNEYWWQLQGYLHLCDSKIGEVSFCLVNTPEILLNDEKYRLFRKMDCATELNQAYLEACEELVNNMTFDDIPESERRIRFIVERDDDEFKRVYKRVKLCRECLSEIENLHINGENSQNSLYLMQTDAN
jgi:hypothetical protein